MKTTQKKSGLLLAGMLAVALTFGTLLTGCLSIQMGELPEGSIILQSGGVVPGNLQLADGSYLCLKAEPLSAASAVLDKILGGERITYADKSYVMPGRLRREPVIVRISKGKVTSILGSRKVSGAAEKMEYSVAVPVWIPSSADLDFVKDFNEARSMIL